ncbi:MAG: hypothetical protein ABIH92_02285 [Nanoarchaeota archaeon]
MQDKRYFYILIVFLLLLGGYAAFSAKVNFHDSFEYITVAKRLAGVNNLDIFITHSSLYPFFISLFLNIWPSLTMIKLVNVSWAFLTGLVLLVSFKNKKAFLLFAFSPLVWYMAIQTNPIVPASFFFFLSYFFLKKEEIKFNRLLSGFFLGLSTALYAPVGIIAALFILVYFWQERFSDFFKYAIMFFVGLLPEMIVDLFVFGNPLYTLIRHNSNLLLVIFGLQSGGQNLALLSNLRVLLAFFVISPLLFKLYKLNIRENKRDVIFLSLYSIIVILSGKGLAFFLVITPILLLHLSSVLKKKEIRLNGVISIFLIVFMIWSSFGATNDALLQRDLSNIVGDFDEDYFVAQKFKANNFATFLWSEAPKIVWMEDYDASKNNETYLRGYNFEFRPEKIRLNNVLEFSASFNRYDPSVDYEDSFFIFEKGEVGEDFAIVKCYDVLCVAKEKQSF